MNWALSGFEPGKYSVSCQHDGWAGFPQEEWWEFTITVDTSGAASRSGPCFINFDRLTGEGVRVIVKRNGEEMAASYWIR